MEVDQELRSATLDFESVCKLMGGQHSKTGDRETCFIERGPRSALRIDFYPDRSELEAVNMGIRPFQYTSRRWEPSSEVVLHARTDDNTFTCEVFFTEIFGLGKLGRVTCTSGEAVLHAGFNVSDSDSSTGSVGVYENTSGTSVGGKLNPEYARRYADRFSTLVEEVGLEWE